MSGNRRVDMFRAPSRAGVRLALDRPGVWEGYSDATYGRPSAYLHDHAEQWQLDYEAGRLVVVELLAAGIKPPFWWLAEAVPDELVNAIMRWRRRYPGETIVPSLAGVG